MKLPVMPPVKPMLAKSVPAIPAADSVEGGMTYEPKWDGFRCIVFRDGDDVVLGSRGEKDMTRYFPEVVDAVRAQLPERCVVDGELIAVVGDRLEFETLAQRIHPAESRVAKLAVETPVSFVAFDLLALDDRSLLDTPFGERRALLEHALADVVAPVHLTPTTTDGARAQDWFEQFEGAGLDGVVAKANAIPYAQDKRLMLKIKHARTADVVVGGYRLHKTSTPAEPSVGSLLLGLYDDGGTLHHIGVASSFTALRRRELADLLEPYRAADPDAHPWHDQFGTPNRWNAKKDMSFVALRPELVCEVGYDHMEGRRFRHTTQFKRWREDRTPDSCTYEQLEEPVSYDLAKVLGQK